MGHFKTTLKYKFLLNELVMRDIKIKYRRSFLGVLWTLLNPLLMMIVLTLIFSNIFRFSIDNFPVYLLCGQLIFNFFSEASNMALTSILSNGSLIKKVYVPKYLFPLSKVFSSLVNLFASFVALLLVMIFTQSQITWTILFAPLPLLYICLFTLGVSLLLSALSVFFRDIMHLYGVLLTAWMYFTPVFYPLDILPEGIRSIVEFNPLTSFINLFREVVMYNQVPTLSLNLVCLAYSLVMLGIGAYVFYKNQDKFILHI
ncbi:ABC transporter permease [Saccharibacillus endophyticus]|uniref:ABC transporter permease n=1 Tax=Saccharibacillus endophyticus TaxID=2060666 RepID=UPI001E2DAAE9|nr:ABC transporter permease [Saccharibacillus endophyticus]